MKPMKSWLSRRLCTHTYLDECGRPLYALRSRRDTPENYERWWPWVLERFVCDACGEPRLLLMLGGHPR